MVAAARDLSRRVSRRVAGRRVRQGLVDQINLMCRDHRAACRRRGIDFPPLAALVLPRLGVVELVRADHDEAAIQQLVVNLVVKHPTVTSQELALAVMCAFPDYRPDTRVDAAHALAPRQRRFVNRAPSQERID